MAKVKYIILFLLTLCMIPLVLGNNQSGHAGFLWWDDLLTATYTDYVYTGTWAVGADGSSPTANDQDLYFHDQFRMNDSFANISFVWKAATDDCYFYICEKPAFTASECLMIKFDDTGNTVQTNNQNNGWDSNAMAFASGTSYQIMILVNSSSNRFKVYVDGTLKATSDAVDFNLSELYTLAFIDIDNAAWIKNFFVRNATSIPMSYGDFFLNIYDEKNPSTLITDTLTVEVLGDNTSDDTTTATGKAYSYLLLPGWYEIRFGNDGDYPKRTYYHNLTTGLNSINLYLLNDTFNNVVMTIRDQDSKPLEDTYVTVYRNYVSGDVSIFTPTSILKTNTEGKISQYFEMYDAYYKFQFANQYFIDVYELTSAIPILSTTPTFYVNTEEDAYEGFSRFDDVVYNLSFVNATGTIYARLIYADSTNILQKACLKVDRISPLDYDLICYNCSTSTSATISCVINHTLEGQYKAVAEFETNTEHSWITVATDFWKKVPAFKFELPGLFLGGMVVITLTMMGIGSVSGSILLMILGLFAMATTTFIMGMTLHWLLYIAIFGMIVIFFIRRSS